jgi:hypothetical protein
MIPMNKMATTAIMTRKNLNLNLDRVGRMATFLVWSQNLRNNDNALSPATTGHAGDAPTTPEFSTS